MEIDRIEKIMIITSTPKDGEIIEIESRDRNCCSVGLNIEELASVIKYLRHKLAHRLNQKRD